MITAAVLMGVGALLIIGPAPAAALGRLRRTGARTRRRLPAWTPAGALLLAALIVGIGLKVLVWTATLAVMAATVAYLVIGHRRRAAAKRRSVECAKAARVLSALLRAGHIPTTALADAAVDFEVLRPAATAARLGGDIGTELERAASAPGQGGMLAVAAAWRVSERSGAPVAEVLGLVAEDLRKQRQLQGVIDTELSAARTSGHIMAALPLLACGLGFLVGVNTLVFLAEDPLGQVLLFAAVCLTAAGVVWIDRLAQSGERSLA